MNKWIDAAVLWWAVSWRFCFSFVVLLFAFWLFNLFGPPVSYEEFIVSTSQVNFSIGSTEYFYTPDINTFTLLFSALVYLIGASAQHAINHPFGKRLIQINYKDTNIESSTWGNGFSLQWSLFWRILVMYIIYSIVLVLLGIKEVVENIDGSVMTTYTTGWSEWFVPIIFGVISAKLLILKTLGHKKYTIKIK